MQLEFPPSTLGGNFYKKNRLQDDMGPLYTWLLH
jgi:hypothetical protein